MNRRQFWLAAGGVLLTAGGLAYLATKPSEPTAHPALPAGPVPLLPAEHEMLRLAALAPSGHNAQPWRVTRHAPFQWTIGNDRTRWLPAVDPTQRETMLSIGAFLQNLESAANHLGYACRWQLLNDNNQSASVIDVTLTKTAGLPTVDITSLLRRRTVRTGYRN
ncbi:nitroreductase family protein [Hymenobacter psoromatis]|uniref:nitroreductase family protein n=1 Tax=Hymenobacter psoromatis TaxID=1484116 RepID=UPI001CBC484C|nr:hypothetical protein [Hymenobacter psoromatis]